MSTNRKGASRRQPTEEQKQAAQARRQRIKDLWRQVAEMDDATRARLTERVGAIVTPEGRELSLNNTLLLMLQRPNATVCGGFKQWLTVGRCVRKGEHALAIWVPIRKETTDAPAPSGTLALMPPKGDTPEGADVDSRKFILGNVFDISQTRPLEDEADEAPAWHEIESEATEPTRPALPAPTLALA